MNIFDPEYQTLLKTKGADLESAKCEDLTEKYKALHQKQLSLETQKIDQLINQRECRVLVNDASLRLQKIEEDMLILEERNRIAHDQYNRCFRSAAAQNQGEPHVYCLLSWDSYRAALHALRANERDFNSENERYNQLTIKLQNTAILLNQLIHQLNECRYEVLLVMNTIRRRCPHPWPWELETE